MQSTTVGDIPIQKIDVAIFVALEEELNTFRSRPPFSQSTFSPASSGVFSIYEFSFIDKNREKRTGVFMLIDDMADRSKDAFYFLRDRYDPKYVVSSGISAAVDKDLFAGDIVLSASVSTPVSKGKFITSKLDQGDIDILFAGDAAPTAEPEARRIRSAWNGHRGTKSYRELIARSFADLRKSFDALPKESKASAEPILGPLLDRKSIAVAIGPTVAIPAVSASKVLRHKLLLRNRKIVAIDMESGYIADSVMLSEMSGEFLSVRAISDFGDDDKNSFEDATKNILRGWAVSNLADVLAFSLEEVLEFSPIAGVAEPKTSTATPLRPASADVDLPNGHVQRREYPSGYINITSFNIDNWNKRYACLVHKRTSAKYRQAPLSEILRLRDGAEKRLPQLVQIRGGQGSGKSTFLDALYFAGRAHGGDSEVISIDLNVYRSKAEQQSNRDVKGIVEAEINNTLRALTADVRILILVDNALDDPVTHSALGHLGSSSSARNGSVVVFAVPEQEDGRGHADTIYGNLAAVIHLGAIPLNSNLAVEFVSTFSEAVSGALITELALANVLKRLTSAGFKEIDPQIISVALRYEEGNPKIGQMRNSVDFAMGWRDQFLRENIQSEGIAGARESANLYAFLDYIDELEKFKTEFPDATYFSRLCSSNAVIRDALIADFICSSLKWFEQTPTLPAVPSTLEAYRLRALGMVFDKSITIALKSRIEIEPQNVLVSQIGSFVGARRLRFLPLCIYLLGRLTEPTAKRFAKESLKTLEQEAEGRFSGWQKDDDASRLTDFCRRAIFISLAYLEDMDAASKYAAEIFSSPAAASLNRGFHREYHGDSAVDLKRGLAGYLLEDDPTGGWSKTRAVLEENLSKARVGALSPRNIVELATYCSFLASRLELGRIPVEERAEYSAFLESFQRQDNKLREHVELLVGALKQKTARVGFGFVLRGIARLKHEPRAGWGRMGVGSNLGHPVETVGSHVFGMAMLVELLLPATPPPDFPYDKAKVIQLVLAHDLGESIIGDRTPDQRDRQPNDERRAIGRISAGELFTNLSNLSELRKLFNEFESAANNNARIARDFDCLDPLLQMFIYRRPNDDVEEVQRFIETYVGRVGTPIGDELLRALQEEAEDWMLVEDAVGTLPPRRLDS